MFDAIFVAATLWLVILKMFEVISWSWVWVFLPLYIWAAIIILMIAAAWLFPDYFEALYFRGKQNDRE